MKKKLLKLVCLFSVSFVVFLFIIKVIDFHKDGSVIRDREYTIETLSRSYRLNVYGAFDDENTRIWFWPYWKGATQTFYFNYIGDGCYRIMFTQNDMCIGSNQNYTSVVEQSYEDTDQQKWILRRIPDTNYYMIINKGNQKAICFTETSKDIYDALLVDQDEEDSSCYFRIY